MSSPHKSESPLLARAQLVALWIIALIGAGVLYTTFSDYVFEDSYITFRYAKNLAEGQGYVFTPGERVFGATAPLHTMVLALLGLLGADIPAAAGILFAGGLGTVGILGGLILRKFQSPNAAMFFALLATSGATRSYASWGLETPLLVTLILAAVLAALHKRDTLAGVLVGLAFLTRYDAALFALSLFGCLLIARKKIPWRPGLVALAVVTPWLLFAQLYFGSVLPNTLHAKLGDTPLWHYLIASADVQLGLLWRPYVDPNESIYSRSDLRLPFNLLLCLSASFAALRQSRREPLIGVLLLFPLALWVGYALIGPPIMFTWYLAPAAFALLVAALIGIGQCFSTTWFPRTRFSGALALVAVALFLIPDLLEVRRVNLCGEIDRQYARRITSYRNVGDWIIAMGLTELTLLTSEPGYLTYRTGNPVIDSAGLVTKGIYLHGDPSRRTDINALIEEVRPPLLVLEKPGTNANYTLAYSAFPCRDLYVRREFYAEHFDEFSREFAKATRTQSDGRVLAHRFRFDLDRTEQGQWNRLGGASAVIGARRKLLVRGNPIREDTLLLDTSQFVAETPPFKIDFDRLAFRLAAVSSKATVAQLVIGNHVVLEQGGNDAPVGNRNGTEFPRVSWPVGLWRGATASVRFLSLGNNARHWLAADYIRSIRSEDTIPLDDFEEAESFGSLWLETFGTKPVPLREIARQHGVQFEYSHGVAATFGLPEAQHLKSRPFQLERDLLTFLHLDFGGPKGTKIQLVVEGKVEHEISGTYLKKLRPVTWDVSSLRGKQAVLEVLDYDPSEEGWIGIDEIYQTDQ